MAKQNAAPGALKLSFPAGQSTNEDTCLCLRRKGVRLLAAFDGCGGIGGRRYEQMEYRTGAHIAAGLYAQCLTDWFRGNATTLPQDHTAQTLDRLFAQAAKDFHADRLGPETSAITGSMVRTLPSTAAIIVLYQNCAALYWAGNTRAYLLTENGLCQLSQDDYITNCDAFDSRYLDAPITNYLCADQRFSLHEKTLSLPKQGVLVLATDGAYHALPSPMHFEAMLLDTLAQTETKKQWKQRLKQQLQSRITDDATLVLQPFGFADHQALCCAFDTRRQHMNQAYILPANQADGDPRQRLKPLWDMYQKEQSITIKNSCDR